MFISRFCVLSGHVFSFIGGGFGDLFYRKVLLFLLLSFLMLRLPYIFGLSGFGVHLVFFISPLFISLFFCRFGASANAFFCSFVPSGTPLWIAPFVCLAETLSYLVRPVVLMIRPFVNLSMGSIGGYVLGAMSMANKLVLVALLFLFFYEVFVAVVHWFIVCNILSFSEDH
nr:ATP synthase F0 subunit 6 [Orientocreadium sp. HS]